MSEAPLPVPLPDETLVSFVVRGERLQGLRPHMSQYALENRRIWATPYGQNHHHRKVWSFVRSLGVSTSESESLSFLPFFQAFEVVGYTRRPCRRRRLAYERVTKRHLSDLKERLSICPRCVQSDHQRLGFSYWRRAHQVRCTELCSEHLCMLIEECPFCKRPLPELKLPRPLCTLCGCSLAEACGDLNLSNASTNALTRIAVATRMIMAGEIRRSLNLERIRRDVRQGVPCRVQGLFNNVARLALERYGHGRLDRIGMHPCNPPTYGWPAIYLGGRWPNPCATIELLLFGLFGSTEDTHGYWSGPDVRLEVKRHVPAMQLNVDFLRHMYRSDSWCEAYESAGLSNNHGSRVCSAYPGLKGRVDAFRLRRTNRHLRRISSLIPE